MTNLDPRMNRISSIALIEVTPNIARLLGVLGTRRTLCVLDVVCSCLVCFLVVCCYLVLVLVFGLSVLKSPLVCKALNRKPSLECVFPLIYLCQLE
jgi:hypothetical protein